MPNPWGSCTIEVHSVQVSYALQDRPSSSICKCCPQPHTPWLHNFPPRWTIINQPTNAPHHASKPRRCSTPLLVQDLGWIPRRCTLYVVHVQQHQAATIDWFFRASNEQERKTKYLEGFVPYLKTHAKHHQQPRYSNEGKKKLSTLLHWSMLGLNVQFIIWKLSYKVCGIKRRQRSCRRGGGLS